MFYLTFTSKYKFYSRKTSVELQKDLIFFTTEKVMKLYKIACNCFTTRYDSHVCD